MSTQDIEFKRAELQSLHRTLQGIEQGISDKWQAIYHYRQQILELDAAILQLAETIQNREAIANKIRSQVFAKQKLLAELEEQLAQEVA